MKLSYAKDVFLSFTLQIFENGRSFLLIPVITKTLGASGYGIWVQVKIGIAFLCPFLLLGTGGGILRFLPGSSKSEVKDGMFSSVAVALITGMGFAMAIIVLEGLLKKYIGLIPNSGLFIKGIALLCVAEPLNSLLAEYYRSIRKMRTLLAFSFFDTVFEFGPVFWFAYNGFGVGIIIFSFACGRSIMAAVKSLSIFLAIGIGRFKIDTVIKYIKFGFPLIWATFFFYILNYIDRYLIGYFHSAKEVGIYSLAYTIGYAVVLMSAPWAVVLIPTITANWNEGKFNEVKEYFEKTIYYMVITIIPLIIFITILAKRIIMLLSTSEFLGGKFIIPIMLISFFFFQGGIYYSNIVKLAYKSSPILILKVFFILAAISVSLNMVIIPKFSIFGAAITMIVVYFSMFIMFFRMVQKKMVIKIGLSVLIKSIIATIPGSILLLFFNNTGMLILTSNVLAALSLYAITLWMTGVIGMKEFTFITTIFSLKKRL
ncbi:MAG: oligosaccharide flippase family protein [Candidatus Omnitrophica bacterium]|nr:oligosaccharide flippase family protein [Candidatus Omnitrophota bacterium]